MRRLATNALLAFSFVTLAGCAPQEETPPKAPRYVGTVTVAEAQVAERISTTGEISARVQSDLSFRVSGRITDRFVEVGDRVKAGQVLARIDAQEQKADLQVAVATLASAEAQQTQAQQAFDRQQSLFSTGVTTRADLDSARETLLRAQATVESEQAQLDTARDTLAQTDLTADADGVITARNAEVGQVAQAAQVIFTLAHDGPRDAVVNVDESLLLGRELADDIEVRLLSGGAPIKAEVREVSPTIDSSSATIRVKLGLEDVPQAKLGSPVVATASFKPQTAIELPWSSMASLNGKPAVWVVDPASHAVSIRPVDVITYHSDRFSIRSGVKPGEIVVATGANFLNQGEVVAIEGTAQ
ncbi:RND family efflux transporter MFP subunit [Neorhizobium galegae]|uniref:efflux RND transporter periplasmic adaptor subunit n=1 Tax=Rhizobium/Agrobacterium group TaxID=227290 RepID=UPI001AE16932|nr:efflux RND transporter periplasmic adaptor subunit [Neorhizobium galegae]MBP2550753.1 RND family efflux transporter MFP subunit [Neorhizobium galegae]